MRGVRLLLVCVCVVCGIEYAPISVCAYLFLAFVDANGGGGGSAGSIVSPPSLLMLMSVLLMMMKMY